MAVSRVNQIIRELLEAGHLEVLDAQVRPFAYRLTERGESYLRHLSHAHYRSVLESFRGMRQKIASRLREIQRSGVRRVAFYGAGEVLEVAIALAEAAELDVAGIVDDDPHKQGQKRDGIPVCPPSSLAELGADAILITTYRHGQDIRARLGSRVGDGARVLQL
jgi:FlaA1/EpsC-like NDP-sugar epimerase